VSILARQAGLIAQLAAELGVEVAALDAFLRVESAGEGIVAGRPLIRLEVHHLWELAPPACRPAIDARFHVAGPRPQDRHLWRPFPDAAWTPLHQIGDAGQRNEWSALIVARTIASTAADEATSWGCGQVLGENWRELGYASLASFVSTQSTEEGQLRCFARFLEVHGLANALRVKDWWTAAQVYNGPGAAGVYSKKLAAAYALG
jgi:hypothetical protein